MKLMFLIVEAAGLLGYGPDGPIITLNSVQTVILFVLFGIILFYLAFVNPSAPFALSKKKNSSNSKPLSL